MMTNNGFFLIFGVLCSNYYLPRAYTSSTADEPCNGDYTTRPVKHAALVDLKRFSPTESRVLSTYGDIGIPYLVIDELGHHHGLEQNIRCLQDENVNGALCFTNNSDSINVNGILMQSNCSVVINEDHKLADIYKKHRQHRRSESLENDLDGEHELMKLLVGFPFKQQDVQKPKNGTINATVEILVWTDFTFFKSYQRLHDDGREIDREILRYIATLVNAADLRMKKGLSLDPSLNVALVLSGVVICKTSNCSWFIDNFKVNNTIDNHLALNHFAEALKMDYLTKFSFRYDFAAVLTRLDVTDPNGHPIGVAFADKICCVKEGRSAAVVEDQGAYSSVGTFVHELAHTLGSDHDGWFRGINCSSADGYIMSTLSPLTKNGFYFSNCSIQSMKENLRKPNASCVFDNPVAYNVESSLSDILPGQIYNTTQQCTQIYGTEFCQSIGTKLEDICYKMYCWDPVLPNVCSTKSPAALGTSCGPQKWCIGGECVYDQRAPSLPNIVVG